MKKSEGQTRRQFCVQVCHGASLAALGGGLIAALEGCGSGGNPAGPSGSFQALPVINATVGNGSISVTVDASSPLATVGSAALVQSPAGDVLVAHTAQDTFAALTAMCTHQACLVSGFGGGNYVCPCHGSQFATNGRVVGGPAPAPLRQFQTQFSGNVLTVVL
jgi:cytochrome b6-f complex iron-sulfur subunit